MDDFPIIGKRKQQKEIEEYSKRLGKIVRRFVDLLVEEDCSVAEFDIIVESTRKTLQGSIGTLKVSSFQIKDK